MKKNNKEVDKTRRGLIKTLGAAGTISLVPGLGLSTRAKAQSGVKDVTVFYYTDGGHSGIFTSANSFAGNNIYGINNGDITRLGGSNLYIDSDWLGKVTAGPNQAAVQAAMCTVGAAHGQSAHRDARPAVLQANGRSALQGVANSMNGASTIDFANVGREEVRQGVMTRNSQAQQINDIRSLEESLGGNSADEAEAGSVVNRTHLGAGLVAAKAMSAEHLKRSPANLDSLTIGYDKGAESFQNVLTSNVTPAQIRRAYRVNGTAVTGNINTKMAAAELLARTGTSVIGISHGGYDNHNDDGQRRVRRLWEPNVGGVATFLNRMIVEPSINLTFVIIGDFTRNQRSGHGSAMSINVISNKVKNGSTGEVSDRGDLQNAPSMAEFYDFIKFLGGGGGSTYAGPHRRLLK